MSASPISSLLIANRGEIAVRIIRTARRLGITTIAVYSDADRDALHVRAADRAIRLGPTPATESYLNIEALIATAQRAGADAIHPGYGFLSERAEFARAALDAGLVFVGPTPEVIEVMGRKDRAREIAVAAGVPVVPSYSPDQDPGEFTYPVLVKAAAGGGGKGMRIVHTPEELDAAVAAAKREATSAFGDDTILIERYVEHGRHVEVQILADAHGNVVHLFERDCSAQRRHQKVIEEAPAPGLSETARKVLHDSAVALAREVGYINAGTVEYLVADDAGHQEAFFLEMNTRLQVEHPVTEAITGLDLVELQLRIASGEPLPFTQSDLTCTGHAFEARVYAEDAWAGFLPQAGTATLVRWPHHARVDAALESGTVVSTAYDPMLGKIVTHARAREAARHALVTALDDTAILGLTSNTGFLRALVASDQCRDSQIHTAWLDAHPDALAPPSVETGRLLAAHALAGWVATDDGPFGVGDGWRSAAPTAPVLTVLDGEVIPVEPGSAPPAKVSAAAVDAHSVEVAWQGQRFVFARPAVDDVSTAATSDGSIVAPMPGTVLSVRVSTGDRVTEGTVLAVMEAMKMELSLKAPFDGVVTAVNAAAGDQVALKHTLIEVKPSATA